MVLVSEHLPTQFLKQLFLCGYEAVALPADPRLPTPVSSHPDMLVFADDRTIITDRQYYETLAHRQIDHVCKVRDLTLILTDEPPRAEYPHDVRFNAARIGPLLICHPTYTSPRLLDYAKCRQWKILPTKQGYAGCSTCAIGDHALITADPSILRTVKKENDLEALAIRQGHISLPGYSHGFFGGCCGHTDDSLFICGSLSHHPDGAIIRDFILAHHRQIVELSDEPLFDAGSLLFIPARHTHTKTSV